MIRVSIHRGTEEEWDDFARAQPGFTHFHQWRWRVVMERVFRHECVYLSARDETGALRGVLPMVRVRSMVFGHYLVSMPFLNYGGPLGSDEAVAALAREAVALAEREQVKLLELRSSVPLDVPMDVSHRKVTVVLPLPDTADALMKGFPAKLRSQVRRAQREGATVQFGAEEVSPFFAVFSRHMRDLGTPSQPLRLFQEVAEQFPRDCWFGTVKIGGVPVAGGCGFLFGDELEMTWASSLRSHSKAAPNMLLYWSFMERAIAHGVRRFNFGRCTPGSGTHQFKLQWGGVEEALWWYDRASTAGVTTPSPNDGAYRWGPKLWRRLPTTVSTAIGPSIVRYLP